MEIRTSFLPLKWALAHPRLSAWAVLSLGMVILLFIEARNIGLSFGNWVALIVATILVAGACIWIVSWEDVDDTDAANTSPSNGAPSPMPESPQDQPPAPQAAAQPQPEEETPPTEV